MTQPPLPSHPLEGAAPHARWDLGEPEDQRRRSYPVRGPSTAASAFRPPNRSSFTPRMATPASMPQGGARHGEGLYFHGDDGRYRAPGMYTFRPVPLHDHDQQRDARRTDRGEAPVPRDVTPPGPLWSPGDARAGSRKTFLTEAVPGNSRLSDSPDSRRTPQPEVLACGANDASDPGLWNYMWRAGRSPSCCSTNTIYANTSDPGAPEPTYENVFECLLRESSAPPVPSPPAAAGGWAEEPIYATLGEQLLDGECVTDFRHETSSPRDHLEDPRIASAGSPAPEGACPVEEDASDTSDTSSGDEFSPSASTLTLRPSGEAKASAAGGHDTVQEDEAKDLPSEADQSGAAAAAAIRHTPPPSLPPKLLHKKPPGLRLHIPKPASPTEGYGLQVRLPMEGEGRLPAPPPPPSPSPPPPPSPSALNPAACASHEGESGASVEAGHSAPRQGSLYVVVGSSASPGELRSCCATNTPSGAALTLLPLNTALTQPSTRMSLASTSLNLPAGASQTRARLVHLSGSP